MVILSLEGLLIVVLVVCAVGLIAFLISKKLKIGISKEPTKEEIENSKTKLEELLVEEKAEEEKNYEDEV